jgi:molybdopterin-binding protein
MAKAKPRDEAQLRIGQAADMLGVTVETIRRWEADGRLSLTRGGGGQRLVPLSEVTRLLRERRARASRPQPTAQSARNRFEGVLTRVDIEGLVAVVEVQAGPHRLVSLMTAEAARELDLRPGNAATCVVKATNVVVEVPAQRRQSDERE